MIVVCPYCQKKLSINKTKYAGKNLSLSCPNCGRNFPQSMPAPVRLLVAHADPEVCRIVHEVCKQDVGEILTCSDAAMARKLLGRHHFSALLLDVALPGVFPFQLIEEIRATGESTKIVLVPSVYNRTAYKRKPSSLYGADGYLEIHHISDQLIPLLQDLLPNLVRNTQSATPLSSEGVERKLLHHSSLSHQAEELARLLIADIALYNQEQIDQGIVRRDLKTRLAAQLTEGRQLLAGRIPQAVLDTRDYLFEALVDFASARANELHAGGRDLHD